MHDIVVSGKIVDIDGIYEGCVAIKDGRIVRITKATEEAKQIFELHESALIFPGFVDSHVHLGEPGWEYKEDFLTGSKAAINGGVTAVGDMPNLPEPIINRQRLLKKIELSKKALVDVMHLGGVGHGNLRDLRDMSQLVPAFEIFTAASTGDLTLSGWDEIEEATRIITALKKPITFHCEDAEIIAKNPERPREAEIAAIEKVLALCREYGTKANIAHLSTKEGLDLVKENDDLDIIYEITEHHMFFGKGNKEYASLNTHMRKMNPPLRDVEDCKALIRNLKDGKCMIGTDHAPHAWQEKTSPNPHSGLTGLDTYGNFVLWLLLKQKIPAETIARITSYNAARYFGISDMGRIKEGFKGSLTVLDTKGTTTISKENLKTKCGWSPFEGFTFPGKIAATIVNGRIYFNKK